MNAVGRTIRNISGKVRGNSLKAKAARGSLVLATGTFAERGMRLVRNMILARLLAPEDFGLMAIVMAILVVLESFTDIGVRQSIIHNKSGDESEYLNIAWWVQFVRGLGLFIIAVLLVIPLICRFYGKPELLDLLRVSLLVVIFNGLTSPRLYLLDKEFRFVKAMILVQGSSLLGTLAAIILAFYMRNVWVLVIGRVAQSGIQCLLSHILCPFRPLFTISRTHLKEFITFGRGMVGLSFLTVVAMQTDVFVLGKLMSPGQVGMYALALALAQQPAFMFRTIVGRVLLPAFAEKQDDRKALCFAVGKVVRVTLIFGGLLAVIAAVGSGPILSIVYGKEYAIVAVPFGILCFTGLFRIQKHILGTVFLAIGKPHLHRYFTVVLVVIVICLIYPGILLFGLAGAAGTLLLANIIAVCMQVVWIRRIVGLTFKDCIPHPDWLRLLLPGMAIKRKNCDCDMQ